ncbi:MAG: DUF6492 family protein [Pseudomonadota bacterium]
MRIALRTVPSTSLITPSYAGDFERCRLLCESVDHFVRDSSHHYLLVASEDVTLFASLAGPRRTVVDERDLLPHWLKFLRVPDWLASVAPTTALDRPIWWSARTWPMRGWHVQQLRRMAIARHISSDGLLYCDSDMVFVRSFETAALWNGEGGDASLRLYCNPAGIHAGLPDGGRLHMDWTRSAARLTGLEPPSFPADDFINNMVSWRRDHVLALLKRIEEVSGRHWVAAIGGNRSFSECQIYGAWAHHMETTEDGYGTHWPADFGLCQTYWSGDALDQKGLEAQLSKMDARQVALGIQSFTGTDPALLRRLIFSR